ncbi:MAG: hypothetical protein ACRCXX_10715, partial [Cetobacterium sp.]|uniref:hypothetical protein n=1 Tax=Cetobacterium sp. TaxID=2071632 RepID=UPI003F358DEF
PEAIINIVDSDVVAIKAIDKMKKDMLVGRSNASLKRDEKLREEFLEKKISNGLTVKKLLEKKDSPKVETSNIKRDILNKDLNQIAIHNFDKTYRETIKEKDLYSIAYAFAKDKDIDLIPKKVELEDSSDKFNAKETLTMEFEDSNRVRHKFVVDVPKLIDDRFLYINGGRKIMNKQLLLLPITKTKPNTVIVTTNYNKLTMERVGANVSPGLEKLKKLLALFKQPGLTVKIGSNRHLNTNYMRSIEYDELAARFMTIKAINKNGNLYLNFNIDKMYEEITAKNITLVKRDDIIPFGIINNTAVVYINNTNGNVMITNGKDVEDSGATIVEFIYNNFETIFGEAFTKEFGEISVGKKYIYTKVIIMKKAIALGLLLAYSEGSITGLLRKLNINYEISTTAPRFDSPIDKMKVGILRFSDCYLVYDARQYRNTLLLEGLNDAPLRMYELVDFDNKDTYIDIFENLLGSKTIANAFDNFRLNMIDPITKEVLEELGYPTDYVEVLAFANGLLEDNAYKLESDMSLYRLRSGELINAYIYKALADAYGTYRITSNNKNPVKVSIAKDSIIKQIMTAPNVEEYSVLNPIIELDKTRTVSFKGLSGLNLEQAYTIDKRLFNPSMLGILGSSTAYSGAVGITRRLTLDANVKSVRGYMQTTETKDVKYLTAKQLFTAAEALNPFVPNHDDAARVLMASTQAGHMVPVENTSKLL